MLNRKSQLGFTLIEILIALAIVAIALTAIIKTTSQHIRDVTYIQDKTIAMWVGTQAINEIRLGIIEVSDRLEKTTTMLNQQWVWRASLLPTPNNHIQEIQVDVFKKPNSIKLIHLTSYRYAK